ncbi:GatB/YqeY domain-containing protein [SAR86 cluster bacterium]|nr:GatB/YqeY domain-containing protein [SAR86 cluster bacterium]
MDSLTDSIKEDLKSAMLSKNNFLRDTLRLVTSEIKRFEVDNRKNPSVEEVISILKKMAKQRKDSINQYRSGGREDLAEIEVKELEVIEQYLPQSFSGEELKKSIQQIINENGFSSMRDMGNLMKILKSQHPNAEMSEASSFIKTLFS